MKKLLVMLITGCLIHPVFATDVQTPDNLLLKINLSLSKANQNGEKERFELQNRMKISSNNHEWEIVRNEKPNKHFLLLSKINSADDKNVKLSFLIVDTTQPNIVSNPELIVQYGQKGEIELKDKNENLKLIVTAEK